MKKWQKEVIKEFEDRSGFEFSGKDRIKGDKNFWERWDWNVRWLENMVNDVRSVIDPYSAKRYDV